MTVFVKWRKEWKILAGEMRRYLRPALLIIIAAFGVLWYSLYGDVKVGQRHDHGWCYKLTVQYKERFGKTLDRSERDAIRQDYAEFRQELDCVVEKYLGEYGIHSQRDYEMVCEAGLMGTDSEYYEEAVRKYGLDDLVKLYEKCAFGFPYNHPLRSLEYKEQVYKGAMITFDFLENLDVDKYYEQERQYEDWRYRPVPESVPRMKECTASGELSTMRAFYMPDVEIGETFGRWMMFVWIVCAALAVPFLTRNRVSCVQGQQFASKIGKAILFRQLGAVLLLAVLVNVIIWSVFCGLLFNGSYGLAPLLDCPIDVGRTWDAHWYDMTFLQYILRMIVINSMIPSMVLTCALFLTTCFCKNYLTAAAAAIPTYWLIDQWFSILDFYPMFRPRLAFPLLFSATLLVVSVATALILQWIRKRDYVI